MYHLQLHFEPFLTPINYMKNIHASRLILSNMDQGRFIQSLVLNFVHFITIIQKTDAKPSYYYKEQKQKTPMSVRYLLHLGFQGI